MKKEREILKKYLAKKGLRLTYEREQILEEVSSRYDHFDVESLFQSFYDRGKDISRATIYRTIPLLIQSGLIHEALRCGERVQYEYIYGHKPHGHLVCIKCGKIIEFNSKELEEVKKKACEKYGFRPIEFRFGIKGYCRDCK